MKNQGFTLIELMVSIVCVAVLTALALPAYNSYVQRGELTEAFNALSSYAIAQQQYYQDQGIYTTSSAATGCGTSAANMPVTTHFSYACLGSNSGQNFVITATSLAVGGLTAGGFVYKIDDANNQTTTVYSGSAVAASCWQSKSSGC